MPSPLFPRGSRAALRHILRNGVAIAPAEAEYTRLAQALARRGLLHLTTKQVLLCANRADADFLDIPDPHCPGRIVLGPGPLTCPECGRPIEYPGFEKAIFTEQIVDLDLAGIAAFSWDRVQSSGLGAAVTVMDHYVARMHLRDYSDVLAYLVDGVPGGQLPLTADAALPCLAVSVAQAPAPQPAASAALIGTISLIDLLIEDDAWLAAWLAQCAQVARQPNLGADAQLPAAAVSAARLDIRIDECTSKGYPVEFCLDDQRYFQGFAPASLPAWATARSPAPSSLPALATAGGASPASVRVPAPATQDDLSSLPGPESAAGDDLFRWLCADQGLARGWQAATDAGRPLHIRLRLAGLELHRLPWETLSAVIDDAKVVVAAADATPFSRYIALSGRPRRALVHRPIRILIAVAAPTNLVELGLAPLDELLEAENIRQAILPLAPTCRSAGTLPAASPPTCRSAGTLRAAAAIEVERLSSPCTLAALERHLRDGVHILHLVAHGGLYAGAPFIVLEDEQRRSQPVAAAALAEMVGRISTTSTALRLVFLASCQTAAISAATARTSLAIDLLRAGAPAVLAMQGAVEQATSQLFARIFYHQLCEHGSVDLASNQARSATLSAMLPGSGIPVLYMRLPDGRLFEP